MILPDRKKLARAAAAIFGAAALMYLGCRLLCPPINSKVSFSREITDRRGRLLRMTLSSDSKYRLRVPLSGISPALVKATLIQEDRFFYLHPGANPFALVRAFYRTYIRRDRRIGGSTLTMQLARLRYRINSKTIAGKAEQMARAFLLEMMYSKKDILEAYLNIAPYGGNIEGAGAAARIFFGKDVKDLTLQEALTLCVIPKSPALREVKGTESPDLLLARQKLFEEWVKFHPEDKEQKSFVSAPMRIDTSEKLPFLAPHFTDDVIANFPAPLRIKTTLDLALQSAIERKLKAYVRRKNDIGIVNASAIVVDIRDMGVRAEVGSADYFNSSISGQVNGAEALRSPGSALKPFIYALAMDQGIIHPMTMLKDAPFAFRGFNPENFDGDFHGPIHARDALIKSRNIPAVYLTSRLKNPSLYSFLKKAGVAPLREESFYGLALALGGAEISMEKMAELYAMLASEGTLRPLRKTEEEKLQAGQLMLSPEAAYLVMDILKDNPPPAEAFRGGWRTNPVTVRWKTGTSAGFRDAWAAGIVGHYVIIVWVGNFDGRPNPAFIGVDAAAPLMFELVDSLRTLRYASGDDFLVRPEGVVEAEVCAVSGHIPGPYCPVKVKTPFIAGKSPIVKCDIHRRVAINKKTGMSACPDDKDVAYATFEFWPSDLLRIFRQAGIPRRLPPPQDKSCALSVDVGGREPVITSPQGGIKYTVGADEKITEKIAFSAVTDTGVSTVYWFVDASYAGAAPAGQPLFWKPHPGIFMIRAVDDRGRAASRKLTVEIAQ